MTPFFILFFLANPLFIGRVSYKANNPFESAFCGLAIAETKELKKVSYMMNNNVETEATPCEDAASDFYEIILGGDAVDIDLLNVLLSYCN